MPNTMCLNIPRSLRNPGSLASLVLAATLAGCDPCSGVGVCGDPQVLATGRVIVHATGQPAADVEVFFIPTGGVPLAQDTFRTRTDQDGWFMLVAPAAGTGSVVGILGFHPPPPLDEYPFAVPDVVIPVTRARGDWRFIGSWGVGPLVSVPPHLTLRGEVFDRQSGEPMQGVEVRFTRTGGVVIEPAVVSGLTNAGGAFQLRMDAASNGTVTGELMLLRSQPDQVSVLQVEMRTSIEPGVVRDLGRLTFGYNLSYGGQVLRGDTGEPAAGVEVEFRRTSGIMIEPETIVVVTGGDGRFFLAPIVDEAGEVVGELILRPAAPYVEALYPGVRMESYEGNEMRNLGIFFIGYP